MNKIGINFTRTGPGQVDVTVTVDGEPMTPEQEPDAIPWVAQFLPTALPVLVATVEATRDGKGDVWCLNPGRPDGPRRLVLCTPMDQVLQAPPPPASAAAD
jgi:hypothetical protein